MSRQKFLTLTPELYDYACAQRSGAHDPLLERLRQETDTLGDISRMQISREQGSFLALLTAAIGARQVIELGTFTGYSALCFARALPEDGRLLCLDLNAEWTSIARRYWREAGVEKKVELRLGPAEEQLQKLPATEQFDLAFVDANKPGYDRYYEFLLPRLRPNGLLLFDNMLYGGHVLDPQDDEDAQALHALNRKLATDPRVECVLLPFADGIQICRKR
ncbi:MAG: class I SAM-dependent methyltransferase [Chthoniobacter sp.]|uniref:O-methyltransferase n=1 Tax=Chthoniobacter sp. TaxID=2510640 RepID=UPI0032A3E5A3